MHSILSKIKYSGLILISIIFLGVKCDSPETLGPAYVLAPEGFKVNSYSAAAPSINFAAPATLGFNADLSHPVSWTIKLKGLTSGAVKEISGTSSSIDLSNPAWLWDGAHSGLYFFMKNEQVEASLTFLGSNVIVKDTITITGTKIFKDVLVADFDSPTALIEYKDEPETTFGIIDTTGGFKIVQGIKAYRLAGTDGPPSAYFVAGMRRDFTSATAAAFPSDPDSLYFNIYVYGVGNVASKLNFGAQEDDGDGTDGVHEPASDDEFQVQISIDHVGWKLFSFKYSDMTPGANPAYGGSGNKIYQPKEITAVSFGLISSPPSSTVEAIFDFPILTFGAPFDPSK